MTRELETWISPRRRLRRYEWRLVLDGRVLARGRTWTHTEAVRQQLTATKHLRFLSVVDPDLTGLAQPLVSTGGAS